MKRVAGAYAPVAGYLGERLAQMPEMDAPEMPTYTLHEYEPLLDSANMTPKDWQHIAQDIVEHYDQYDGFVILHGTDTMAYTASALSFMLEHLTRPVILTGSQIPLTEVRSDARENLITSMLLAAHVGIPEVCLYLAGTLLRGNRSRKVSSSGFNAFESPNFPPLGTVGVDIRLNDKLIRPKANAPLHIKPFQDATIGTLRLFPGITAQLLKNFLQVPVQGFVLETYGAGNAPANDQAFLDVIQEATGRGVVIVNCTQCLRGSVSMDDYATGNALSQAGVISGFDMTPEAALTKLLYLFSQDLGPDVIRQEMQRDLRGELTRL